MGYIRKRLKQTSTWIGLAAAGAALYASGGIVTPEVTSTILAALGLVHIDDSKE